MALPPRGAATLSISVTMMAGAVAAISMAMRDSPAERAARAAQAAVTLKQFRIASTDGATGAGIGARVLEFSGRR